MEQSAFEESQNSIQAQGCAQSFELERKTIESRHTSEVWQVIHLEITSVYACSTSMLEYPTRRL
jgi:hypothetical protein